MNASRTAPLYVAELTLAACDIGLMRGFYERAIGLALIEETVDGVVLGAGGRPILRLISAPEARPEDPGSAGLFHTAILLPGRADLARWLRHAAETDVTLTGASDHGVSEAIYLDDPEGNGVEIYRDRAREDWPRDEAGGWTMYTRRLDLRGVMDAGEGAWDGAPEGTVLGHAHLRVGELAKAKAFYGDALGFELMKEAPGAAFLASGGYHHHLGANTWRAEGAGRREGGQTGFAAMTLETGSVAALAERLAAAGVATTPVADGFAAEDPWGLKLQFRAAV